MEAEFAENSSAAIGDRGKKHLTFNERRQIVEILLNRSNRGKLDKGSISTVALQFHTTRQKCSKLWNMAKQQIAGGQIIDVSSRLKGHCGRKSIPIDTERLKNTPLGQRTTMRSVGCALGISKSKVHEAVQSKLIKAHSNAIKPLLTPGNMRGRVVFCVNQLQETAVEAPTFKSNHNTIHIDEKWFYMTKPVAKYYLGTSEEDPVRMCKSKSFIAKVMFLAAVARPVFGQNGKTLFDGKIGIFPFVYEEPAKRRSKNREAGVMETKSVTSVTKEYTHRCLIEQLLPAIKSKWPIESGRTIYIQQDNARPHIDPKDPEWKLAASSGGWDIRLTFQPPNSPDLNVLDLGFFRAIDSIQHRTSPKTITDLLNGVTEAYQGLSADTLNFVWLSLQLCMIEILMIKGSNAYKIPHMGKERLLREGTLPVTLTVDPLLIAESIDFLSNPV